MDNHIELLDCTLRDGAYITDSMFGTAAIRGIIKQLQDAGTEIIECGWLKDSEHKRGSSFYHIPSDLEPYLVDRQEDITYVVMIDWDRYDITQLPPCDHQSIDAIRVVFPKGRHHEAIEIGSSIRKKGYRVFFQAANTLGYSNKELVELADAMNKVVPESLSVVDTFGAMYEEDLGRIVTVLDERLDPAIQLGFHSHNNQQLSFSLTIHFIKCMEKSKRDIVVDSSLCGMGRGAGNTTTELLVSYLNRKQGKSYDLDAILDAIDIFMEYFEKNYSWGYSTPYFISGMYCTHVNNIAYLLKKHRTNAKDMRNIIESMPPFKRLAYDYDFLEEKYLDYYQSDVDHVAALRKIKKLIGNRPVLMLCSGRSIVSESEKIKAFIKDCHPVIIGINAMFDGYDYDLCFFSNHLRYMYMEMSDKSTSDVTTIMTSNIYASMDSDTITVDFNSLIKRGWKYFDNAGILCLRLLRQIGIKNVILAGFDGFRFRYEENYADQRMPSVNSDNDWDVVNKEIREMLEDFYQDTGNDMQVTFLTESIFA